MRRWAYHHEMHTRSMEILERMQRRSISSSIVKSNRRRIKISSAVTTESATAHRVLNRAEIIEARTAEREDAHSKKSHPFRSTVNPTTSPRRIRQLENINHIWFESLPERQF